ncbi:MAG: L-arabinose isomerase [Anaerolineales bacterium]|nr:MAG: L-arabinose isomerase [Anaerolineales bacterium]
MDSLKRFEVWFITGSQHLYGEDTLRQVAENSNSIARVLGESRRLPVKCIAKPVLTSPEAIYELCLEANGSKECVGLIVWMHTFSPAKMWIAGLNVLQIPFVHLHTQFYKEIPWGTIDMDFMNLNQSAHGGREFGFINTRMRLNRKVIVGHWKDEDILRELEVWVRAACAWKDSQNAKIARFGDNMREVAVTEGDKVAAQIRFGYAVNGYGLGDLVQYIDKVRDVDVTRLVKEYEDLYEVAESLRPGGDRREALLESAKIEIGLRAFLEEGDFVGFTTTFENLHGLPQLPGIAVQRLMAEGYGFGAEGDWKTAALVRAMKVMASGIEGGTSFMEDYTYHLEEGNMMVLGAHMLEICPTIAEKTPSLEIHPLSIGGKADPVRLVFDVPAGPGINAAVLDMGNRFRILVNEVEVVSTGQALPKLPVARAVWVPKPDLKTAATAWILAGGPHHTGFSQAVTSEHIEDFAEMVGVEYLLIDDDTHLAAFKKELMWNESYYYLSRGIG